jgi:hypothetical protein
VGSVWQFQNKMGPLIHPPEGDLLQALTTLDPHETWALKPENIKKKAGNLYINRGTTGAIVLRHPFASTTTVTET